MKTAITYTVLSTLNLIGFVIGVILLPAQVPIHFDVNMTADAVGSPWVYVALPAAAALISAALLTTSISKRGKNRKLLNGLLAGLGAILICIGWAFFALIASGVKVGERVNFPFALVTLLPISILMIFFGNYLPRIEPNRTFGIRTFATLKSETVWVKTHRLAGYLFFGAGLLSAVSAVLFSCLFAEISYVSIIIFCVALLIAAIVSFTYAEILYRREKATAGR